MYSVMNFPALMSDLYGDLFYINICANRAAFLIRGGYTRLLITVTG